MTRIMTLATLACFMLGCDNQTQKPLAQEEANPKPIIETQTQETNLVDAVLNVQTSRTMKSQVPVPRTPENYEKARELVRKYSERAKLNEQPEGD